MSIVAIKGVPAHWSLNAIKFTLVKTKMRSGYEVLNYDQPRGIYKTAYVNFSEKWDPLVVVQKINRLKLKAAKLTAFIPSQVPDLPLAKPKATKTKKVRATGQTFEWKLVTIHRELLDELICKYTRLLDLSKKTGHKLLDEIAETLFRRLKHVMQSNAESTENCFTLGKGYRKKHPAFGDFQLILSTLHQLEDASGAPRTQLAEAELKGVNVDHDAAEKEGLPKKKVNSICNKYESRIINKLSEYIEGVSAAGSATPEEAARARVRRELKKIAPYLTQLVREVVSGTVVTDHKMNHMMRVYGEPFLPPKDVLLPPLVRRCKATNIVRSQRLYNVVRFNVPVEQFANAMSIDGTVLGGATLVVRPSPDADNYKIKPELLKQMNSAFAMETDQA